MFEPAYYHLFGHDEIRQVCSMGDTGVKIRQLRSARANCEMFTKVVARRPVSGTHKLLSILHTRRIGTGCFTSDATRVKRLNVSAMKIGRAHV